VPTIVLTGILLFVVLFYVYPLKFVFTLVVNQIIGVPPSHNFPHVIGASPRSS
jgi:hypothetical protein